MTGIRVRSAAPEDAHAIARLLGQLGYPTEPAEVPHRLRRLAAGGRAEVFLADLDGRVVGLATAHVLSTVSRRLDVAWLTALIVDESVRGAGVGRALVEAVEAFARRSGCERLSVTTHEDRRDAQAFYVRVGLAATGRRFGKMLLPTPAASA